MRESTRKALESIKKRAIVGKTFNGATILEVYSRIEGDAYRVSYFTIKEDGMKYFQDRSLRTFYKTFMY